MCWLRPPKVSEDVLASGVSQAELEGWSDVWVEQAQDAEVFQAMARSVKERNVAEVRLTYFP